MGGPTLTPSPAALIPVKDTGTHTTRGWVGPRADLDG